MANEFLTKPTSIKPAIVATLADPDDYNANITAQSKDSILGIDEDGKYKDINFGDEAIIANGALIADLKFRETGNLNTYNASGVLQKTVPVANIGAGSLLSVQTFTSSGTWNKPAGINSIVVKLVAAGGGGGDPSSGTGATGGSTSFGAHCSATGGIGGEGNNGDFGGGGLGGIGSNGDINTAGNGGTDGSRSHVGNASGAGIGAGGGSVFGGGAPSVDASDDADHEGIDGRSGGGGGGGFDSTNFNGSGGGGGGGYAEKFISSGLGSSEVITIGTGGLGAGSAGTKGGDGGDGLMIVYEYS